MWVVYIKYLLIKTLAFSFDNFVSRGKNFSKDFSLRFASTAISTISSKVIVIPLLAAILSNKDYGTMLTIVGIESIIALVLGNALYSVRMIMHADYAKNNIEGDFNLLAVGIVLFSGILCIPLLILFPELSQTDKILLIPYVMLSVALTYYSVYYAVFLKFKEGLYQSIVGTIGLLVGLFLTKVTHSWTLCYVCASAFGLIWIAIKTPVIHESYTITPLFNITFKKYWILAFATLLGGCLVYADRLLLYPIIGPTSVAIYMTAAYLGKSVAIIVGPVSGVLLSYFAQGSFNMTRKRLVLINIIALSVFLLLMIILVTCGKWAISIFFPSLYYKTAQYIVIASGASGISAVYQFISPIALKYVATKWQAIVQSIYAVIYIVIGIPVIRCHGIVGLCYLVLWLNIFQYVFYDYLCFKSIKNTKTCK
jgi:O-antigen/teichoic acid export membrane protein